MADIGDSMGKHLGDGVTLKTECGHPNVQPGEPCPLCGKKVVEIRNGIHITEEK